ncbi:hypothetical protein C8R41DRAFT_926489 [Lentinula lateritia]|uniref:Uncharacterized protein n=1 Tax=Lentinula lateritia TaxID=40482 RepID=A0ABQ8V0R9_9AGAR|nr:hypothetical protein C8R41DRAFT_926489 [Lentinula lateritia]
MSPSPSLGPPWTLQEPLQGSHPLTPATTRSFPSLVAVSVAPFELQPAPSTLQHKLLIPKPTLRPILTQVLQYSADALPFHPTSSSQKPLAPSPMMNTGSCPASPTASLSAPSFGARHAPAPTYPLQQDSSRDTNSTPGGPTGNA